MAESAPQILEVYVSDLSLNRPNTLHSVVKPIQSLRMSIEQ